MSEVRYKIRLTGECNQCGKCCNHIYLWQDDYTFDEYESGRYIIAHNGRFLKIPKDHILNNFYDGGYVIEYPIKCVNHSLCSNQKTLCKIHDFKPKVCARFPSVSDPSFHMMKFMQGDKCGYDVEVVEVYEE